MTVVEEQNSHDGGSLRNSHPRLTLTPVRKWRRRRVLRILSFLTIIYTWPLSLSSPTRAIATSAKIPHHRQIQIFARKNFSYFISNPYRAATRSFRSILNLTSTTHTHPLLLIRLPIYRHKIQTLQYSPY